MPATLPYAMTTLDNGLDVIVHEAHACPIVAVSVWYHVGSKNERPGRTGFAHLFEHLMFEGSAHHDAGYFRPLEEAGGALNGSTNADRTNYWEVVPREAVERALWLESDRMGYLLPALSGREVRDTARGRPERAAAELREPAVRPGVDGLAAAHFPAAHPYHWPTIGRPADVRAAHLDDVRDFFATYYHPANASLAIAGDIDTDEALALAARYFGEIPAGATPPAVALPAEPPSPPASSLYLEDRVELSRIYLAWRTPALFEAGDAELDLLAELLAGGLSSAAAPGARARAPAGDGRRRLAELARAGGDVHHLGDRGGRGRARPTWRRSSRPSWPGWPTKGPARTSWRACSGAWREPSSAACSGSAGSEAGPSSSTATTSSQGTPDYFGADRARYLQADAGGVRAAAARLAPDRRVALCVVPPGSSAAALPGAVPAGVS